MRRVLITVYAHCLLRERARAREWSQDRKNDFSALRATHIKARRYDVVKKGRRKKIANMAEVLCVNLVPA